MACRSPQTLHSERKLEVKAKDEGVDTDNEGEEDGEDEASGEEEACDAEDGSAKGSHESSEAELAAKVRSSRSQVSRD